ncbi:MAG: Na+/H+ antiporter NhaC [Chlamydiales bacterium]|jgi:Na+/H+ antiporter NhaC
MSDPKRASTSPFMKWVILAMTVAVLLMVKALFSLPQPDVGRLGALRSADLLAAPVQGDQDERPLWKALLATSAASNDGQGHTLLRLGSVRVSGVESGAEADPELDDEFRRAIARGLRSIQASNPESLPELELVGLEGPVENGAAFVLTVTPDSLSVAIETAQDEPLVTEMEWRPAGRGSLIPPVAAILIAVLFRQPVLALFFGVLGGAFLLRSAAGVAWTSALPLGMRDVFDVYLRNELFAGDRQYIIGFVLMMLAMVGIMTRAGGIRGLMDIIARFAHDARRTQIATWLMGLVVFFDDYANTILVGATMRPLSDRFKVAREKLAYIVDSTAAPVAGLSIFSTWIAFEVSTFSAQLPDVGMAASDGYGIFIQTLPYRFYCIFTLIFVGTVVISGRDFGPMLRAERRARAGKVLRDGARPMVGDAATKLEAAEGVSPSAMRALIPLALFLGLTLVEIFRTGGAMELGADLLTLQGLADVLSKGNPMRALALGSAAGMLGAAGLALGAGIAREILPAAWAAVRSMLVAILILYLAWMIGAICRDLGTASYLTVLLGNAINPLILPCILFVLSGVVAFSTGSSWSTMSILLPIVVGMAFALGETTALGGTLLMVISIGAVLEGAIFGDHCSPISDTTIMSSIASASDHIDHVRTQAPYSVVTMLLALGLGYAPVAFLGLDPWIGILAGTVAIVVGMRFFGTRAEAPPTGTPQSTQAA